ncbi:MAG TPA: response regulator [Blastocatellia bacterium]|nr:response regulator [Blastocatellia bacterium]
MADATILVVDDSPTDVRLLSNTLQGGGYRIITASDGDEALNKAKRERPGLILLDVLLPKKNGFQVCRDLKTSAETRDIPVILISSKRQDIDKVWGIKQGADEYITKPWNDDELLTAIARHL